MATIDPSTFEAVNNANYKAFAETGTFMLQQFLQDSVDHRRRVNALSEAHLASALKNMSEVDPTEAIAQVKQLTGNDLGKQMADLGSVVAALQQLVKAAQSTPPETGK